MSVIGAAYTVNHAPARGCSADSPPSLVSATYTAVELDIIADSNPTPATMGRGASSASSAEPDAALTAACSTRATIRPRSRLVFIYGAALGLTLSASHDPTSVKVSCLSS